MPHWPDALPRHRLIEAPSPLMELPRLAAALGGRTAIWVKREDLLAIGLGGNKLRHLEFLVGDALAEGADTLVTTGRRWSNHARLTAAAGAHAGLAVHLVLSGPPAVPSNPGVDLAHRLGATVHQAATDDRAEREALLAAVVARLRSEGRRPYVIGVGGSGALGATGQVVAGWEAFEQARAMDLHIDRIVVPSATGGTQAGLIVAAAGDSPDSEVVGVIVARPEAELRPVVTATVDQLAPAADVVVPPGAIRFDGRQLGPGYGRPTTAADEAADLLARTEGLFVDPIYTAKALAALVDDVRDGSLDGRTALFWHAGGTPGLFEPLDA
jgi:1-aminocyclopropane-1-carboxylate deaminase/D-cysteine desulfhydrase-like pyridoxal-dependent ACC family enzyme